MIWAALGFLLGFIACAHAPEPWRVWVKGFTGNAASQVRPVAANNPIRAPSLAEMGERAWSVIDAIWRWKYVILAVFLFVVIGGMLRGCNVPFLGQSADDLRAEIAESETEHAQAERDVAVYAGQRGDETQRRERVIETVVAQGKQDIEDAASTQDFDRLYSAYRIAYDRSLRPDAGSDARNDDPPARRPPLVRQPSSNRA